VPAFAFKTLLRISKKALESAGSALQKAEPEPEIFTY